MVIEILTYFLLISLLTYALGCLVRVLRRIFGPKRDEATGEWRKLHKKELNDLFSSPDIGRVIKPRRMRWGVRSTYGEEERRIQGFSGETCGKEQLGRPRRRWEDNIKMDLQEVVAGTCECVNEPSGSIKCGEFLD